MRPKRNRDRRQANAVTRARQLLVSLRSYLMAIDDHSQSDDEEVIGQHDARARTLVAE